MDLGIRVEGLRSSRFRDIGFWDLRLGVQGSELGFE